MALTAAVVHFVIPKVQCNYAIHWSIPLAVSLSLPSANDVHTTQCFVNAISLLSFYYQQSLCPQLNGYQVRDSFGSQPTCSFQSATSSLGCQTSQLHWLGSKNHSGVKYSSHKYKDARCQKSLPSEAFYFTVLAVTVCS